MNQINFQKIDSVRGKGSSLQSNKIHLSLRNNYLGPDFQPKKIQKKKENVDIIQIPILKEIDVIQTKKIYEDNDKKEKSLIASNLTKVGLLVMENRRLTLEYKTQLKILQNLRKKRLKKISLN